MNTCYPLNNPWNLLPVATFTRGQYEFDKTRWLEQDLPAHWQQHPLLAHYSGKIVYRKCFSRDQITTVANNQSLASAHPSSDQRLWLRFNGIFYYSRPYFNHVDLGQHEGYFTPFEHEITALVRNDNELIVEVDCPDEHNNIGKRLITGVFSHWDCIDPETNPGGIWRPVEVITTGPTRIKELLLDTQATSEAQATIRFRATADAAHAGSVRMRWTIAPRNFAGIVQTVIEERVLAAGVNDLNGTFPIRDPQIWWTHDLGHPNCYTVTLEVLQGGHVSDTHVSIFGIRRFELKNWIAYLNGVRLFIKGNNYAPGDTRIATMTRERCEADIRLARECHINMLRVHAHIDTPEFYELADENGMLLWQDFPLQWLYHREVMPEAERQARLMVRQLYNHPAIALWCMHNEAIYTADTKDERALTKARVYGSVFGWSWNRDVLDTRLKRVAESEDKTRPVVRSSGEYAVPGTRPGTDTHFYYGWYTFYGKLRDWEGVVKRFPANIRFVTEFGAQSFPNLESCVKFMDADITKIDWDHLVTRHQFQSDIMAHWLDWQHAKSLAELVEMTQRYQIEVNRFYIDRLRFHKYRPTGGIIPFMFHDPNPAVQWSLLDYWRVPKASYHAMRLAFSPQYAFALLAADEYFLGEPCQLPVYLVNDSQHAIAVQLRIQLLSPTGLVLARAERDITLPADCQAIEIERLRLTPDQRGVYKLVLVWEGDSKLENVYELRVM